MKRGVKETRGKVSPAYKPHRTRSFKGSRRSCDSDSDSVLGLFSSLVWPYSDFKAKRERVTDQHDAGSILADPISAQSPPAVARLGRRTVSLWCALAGPAASALNAHAGTRKCARARAQLGRREHGQHARGL